MKKLLILIPAFAVFGCSSKQADKKAIMDSVMQIHEKVMGADEQLMKNKILLDSAVAHNSTAGIKDSVYALLSNVNLADSAMGDWMHKFDYEQKGKSEEDVITYMRDQKRKIMSIDSLISSAVAKSDSYLKKIKMK